MDRDTCAVCETTFDGNTPRTTPGCELCGTCESCGCQVVLDTLATEAAIQRRIMQMAQLATGAEDLHAHALKKLQLIEAHQRELDENTSDEQAAHRIANPLPAATVPAMLYFWGRPWTLIETNAPADYDYMPAITLYQGGGGIPGRRLTLLSGTPAYITEYQFPRYRSGMYQGDFSADYTVEEIEEALFRSVKSGALTTAVSE